MTAASEGPARNHLSRRRNRSRFTGQKSDGALRRRIFPVQTHCVVVVARWHCDCSIAMVMNPQLEYRASGGLVRVLVATLPAIAFGLAMINPNPLRVSSDELDEPHASVASDFALVTSPPLSMADAEAGPPSVPIANLPPLHIENIKTKDSADLRLYLPSGEIDPEAAVRLDELLADVRDPNHVHTTVFNRRALQLVFKAAYHFNAPSVEILSGYRVPRRHHPEGQHGKAAAVDFRLANVRPSVLAQYLHTFAKVGVGLYTDAQTQFVHLDDRQESYHWVDASPPGMNWGEKRLRLFDAAERDAQYAPWDDWPERTLPSGRDVIAQRQSPDEQSICVPQETASLPVDGTEGCGG